MKRQTKLWRVRRKAISRSPAWLKTVQIAKRQSHQERGSFGPASAPVRIDPMTGERLDEADGPPAAEIGVAA